MKPPVMYQTEPKALLWLDWRSGRGVDDFGNRVKGKAKPALADILALAANGGWDRVFLTGARPDPATFLYTPTPEWIAEGHYHDADFPVARFERRVDRRRVEVRRAAEWFGESLSDPDTLRQAWLSVSAAIARHFGTGAHPLASPTVTGRDCWARSLPPDWAIEPLDAETRELIYSSSPQHRIQLVADYGPGEKLPGFAYIDGRMMYAALTRELGTGPVTRLGEWQGKAFDGRALDLYQRARYRVTFHVPDDWAQLGLFMVAESDGQTYSFPNAPGYVGSCWADAAEVRLAIEKGWVCTIHDAMIFAKGRPLDVFTDRVIRARAWIAALEADDEPKRLAAAALRSMLLLTIGGFHSRYRTQTNVAQTLREVPTGARAEQRGEVFVWREKVPLDEGRSLAFARPELSSQVWGRAHARILESPTGLPGVKAGALHVPPGELIGIRGDALYLTRNPGWPDDGKPGRLRVKGELGPVPAPRSWSALNELREKSEVSQ